jgi:hypothetical protein
MEEAKKNERVYRMKFSDVYPLLVQKAQKKGRTKDEVDTVICWLTGYSTDELQTQAEGDADLYTFFSNAPQINPNAHKITGVVCGVRVEEIEDPLVKKVRQLDKMVDELAIGKAMDKILRTNA